MTSPPRFSKIEVEASEWLIALSENGFSNEQRQQFNAWLSADPEHQRVYNIQKLTWHAIGALPPHSTGSSGPHKHVWKGTSLLGRIYTSETRRPQQDRLLATAAVLVFTVLCAWSGSRLYAARDIYETGVAEIKTISLGDGSVVTLSAMSRIEVILEKSQRRVVLKRGEAFFNVVHDDSRPFFVTANQTLVRDVGTQFDVHFGADSVRIGVIEGRVQVFKTDDSAFFSQSGEASGPALQTLTAGREVIAQTSGEMVGTTDVKTENLAAWRSGRLVYVDTPLCDVIADINRYYKGKIELTEERIGHMQLTTTFRIDQIDRMLEVLQQAAPVEIDRSHSGRIILRERQPHS